MNSARSLLYATLVGFSLIVLGQDFQDKSIFEPDMEKEATAAYWDAIRFAADVDPERRKRAIAYTKRKLAAEKDGNSSMVRTLISLRDEETIRSLEKEPNPEEVLNILRDCRSPVAFEVLGPILFIDEPWQVIQSTDTFTVGASFQTAGAMPYMLSRMAGFSPEVLNWAQKFEYHYERAAPGIIQWQGMRDLFREWWRKNEVHFRNKDYQAVTPPDYVIPELPPRHRSNDEPAPDSTPSPASSVQLPSTLASQPPTTPFNPTPWVIGTLLLMFGGLC
jgi:hypothetical protein